MVTPNSNLTEEDIAKLAESDDVGEYIRDSLIRYSEKVVKEGIDRLFDHNWYLERNYEVLDGKVEDLDGIVNYDNIAEKAKQSGPAGSEYDFGRLDLGSEMPDWAQDTDYSDFVDKYVGLMDIEQLVEFTGGMLDVVSKYTEGQQADPDAIYQEIESGVSDEDYGETVYELVGTMKLAQGISEELYRIMDQQLEFEDEDAPEPPEPPEIPDQELAEAFRRFVEEYTERHQRLAERRVSLRERTSDTSDIEEAESKIQDV